MEELELKHLAPYLPYGLMVLNIQADKLVRLSSISSLGFLNEKDYQFGVVPFGVDAIKPILRHLSSMTKKEAYDILCLIVGIEDIGFEQSDLDYISLNYEYDMLKIKGEFPFDDYVCGTEYTINISNDGIACFDTGSNGIYISHSAYNYLFSKHFDVFGLIDEGLAIEKNNFK